MPAVKHDSLLLRLVKDINDIRSALRRVTVNLPLYDIANENTPDALTGDANDYVVGNYDIVRLSSTLAISITGLKRGVKGRSLRVFNIGDYEITFTYQDASSTAEYRIITDTTEDLIVSPGGWVEFYYDSSVSRWRATGIGNSTSGDRITVELQLSSAQSIANASYEQISWDSVIKDTGNFFDAGNPTYVTIPATGWYQTTLHITFDTNGTNLRETLLEKSPTPTHDNIAFDSRLAVTGASTNVELSRLEYFLKDERVYSTVWQNSGGALDVNVNGPRGSATTLIVTRM